MCIKQLVSAESTGKKRKASASKNASTDGSQLEEAAEADEPPAQAIYNAAHTHTVLSYYKTLADAMACCVRLYYYFILSDSGQIEKTNL